MYLGDGLLAIFLKKKTIKVHCAVLRLICIKMVCNISSSTCCNAELLFFSFNFINPKRPIQCLIFEIN